MIVKKRLRKKCVCSNDSAYQAPNVVFILMYTLICERVRLLRGCMSGQLASVILLGIFLFSYFVCVFVCFASPCVSIGLVCIQEEIRHSFIHSVALRLPFSQRRAEAAFIKQLRSVALKRNKKSPPKLFKHFVICFASL